jgi:hypothetical protein
MTLNTAGRHPVEQLQDDEQFGIRHRRKEDALIEDRDLWSGRIAARQLRLVGVSLGQRRGQSGGQY